MIELYSTIRDEVRETAANIWNIAISYKDPASATNFLNIAIEYYKNLYTEEEIEFLQFYFQMKMEMMKE